MKYKSYSKLFFSLMLALSITSCQRSTRQFVEDTKTAGQYSAKALRSMGGKHGESRQVSNDEDFGWQYPQSEDPHALEDHIAALDAQDPYAKFRFQQQTPGDPQSGLPPYEKFVTADGELEKTFGKIYFDTNDDIIRGQNNVSRAIEIAGFMKSHPDLLIYIEGHCDQRGTASYNLSLGARRASSIRNLLIEEGVDPRRIFTISFGKERPIANGEGEESWRQNRRGQFKVLFR